MNPRSFRATLSEIESARYIVVPSFAIHNLTSEVLSSLLYNRKGIRPVQQIDFRSTGNTDSFLRMLLSLGDAYKDLLDSCDELQKTSPAINPECLKRYDQYRAIMFSPSVTEKDVYEAFKSWVPRGSKADLSWIKIYQVNVHYSYWNVSLSVCLKKLFQSIEGELKKHNSTSGKDTAEFSWDDFYVHSFEQVGHIAHLNLPGVFSASESSTLKDAKFILGSMILDHHPHLSIVINKTKNIDSEFREMSIEVLAIRPPVACLDDSMHDSFHFSLDQENIDEKEFAPLLQKSVGKNMCSEYDIRKAIFKPYYTQNLPPSSPLYTVRSIKHNGCKFTFSFYHCFFNKRLEEEHRRIKSMVLHKDEYKDVVFDVFAGVGPISVPIAVRRVTQSNSLIKKGQLSTNIAMVHANDLNPMCYRYLKENATINKILLPVDKADKRSPKVAKIENEDNNSSLSHSSIYQDLARNGGNPLLQAWNMDGLVFIRESLQLWKSKNIGTESDKKFCHFVMNLPGSAAENFLTPFGEIMFAPHEKELAWNPYRGDGVIVHVHTFATKSTSDFNFTALEKIHTGLHKSCEKEYLTLESLEKEFCINAPETIRNIAPRKEMVRVSFALTRETAQAFRSSRLM